MPDHARTIETGTKALVDWYQTRNLNPDHDLLHDLASVVIAATRPTARTADPEAEHSPEPEHDALTTSEALLAVANSIDTLALAVLATRPARESAALTARTKHRIPN